MADFGTGNEASEESQDRVRRQRGKTQGTKEGTALVPVIRMIQSGRIKRTSVLGMEVNPEDGEMGEFIGARRSRSCHFSAVSLIS